MRVPLLVTDRLQLREFTLDDLDAAYQLLDVALQAAEFGTAGPQSRAERATWLQWTVLNYGALAQLYQPPYGDRAIVLKTTGTLIGACGFVPCLGPYGQVPALAATTPPEPDGMTSTEFGLFYAIAPSAQRHGYGSEAAQALLDYAFGTLQVRRVVATTTDDNAASQAVMRRLGMQLYRNPRPTPPWFQVIGVLAHPALRTTPAATATAPPSTAP